MPGPHAPGGSLAGGSDPRARDRGRSRARSPNALGRPYVDFADGVRKQASLPRARYRSGWRARLPAFSSRAAVGWRSPSRVRPVSCDGSGRTPSRRPRSGGCSLRSRRHATGSSASSARANRRSPGPRRGGGGRRARDHRLRPRLRDPRRPLRRGRRGCGEMPWPNEALRERVRRPALRGGRATDRGDRPRALPGARLDARDGRVLHGRAWSASG